MVRRVEPLENALHSVKLTINSILEELQTKEFTIYITGEGNFRLALDPEYKANRDPNAKPYYYKEIKKYLLRVWDAQEVVGYEADDALTCDQIDSVVYMKEDDDKEFHVEVDRSYSCICSIDKDLDMVPGFHYNWQKDRKYFVTPEDGIKNFYRQLITGDPTDNIPGLYKVTGKRFSKHLKEKYEALPPDPNILWGFVSGLYGHENRERIITNGKLLWMVRYPGDNWEPPND